MREMVYTRQFTGHYYLDFSAFSSASNEVAFLLKPTVSPGIAVRTRPRPLYSVFFGGG